jgi:FAD:protein FMN transferase
MASTCELIMDTQDPIVFETHFRKVKAEALRLEQKYSRYRDDNIVHQINSSEGEKISVDEETALLIDFAFYCHQISNGLFDITSGVLRTIWDFKNFKKFPDEQKIKLCLKKVGLQRVQWKKPFLKLEKDMQFDFGGIVKEYAVDKCASFFGPEAPAALINFGGDIFITRTSREGKWAVAIEEAFKNNIAGGQIEMGRGALATSGDTHRYFEYKGKRYSHILNPKTGYPVSNGVATVTVFSETCTLAGMLSTISHLQPDPKRFLEEQGVKHWVLRHKNN